MKISIYIQADTYADCGWSHTLVSHANKWRIDYYQGREDAFLLYECEIPEPDEKELVRIGLLKVEELTRDMNDHIRTTGAKIKEYESKFLLLDAPASEDLS